MIDALVTGKLAAAPQARTTKAGKPMATARLRVPTTDPAHNAPHPGLLVFARMADALEGRPLPGTQHRYAAPVRNDLHQNATRPGRAARQHDGPSWCGR